MQTAFHSRATPKKFYISVDEDDRKNAFNSAISDYEDAVLDESAKRNKMDCIVTRNEKNYKKSSLKVFGTEDFLQRLLN